MSVQNWLRQEEAKSVNQRPEMVTSRRLLASFLEGDKSEFDAAVSVIETYRESFEVSKDPKPLEQFWMIFSLLTCSVGCEPLLAERMVDLFFAISQQPVPSDPASGKPLGSDEDRVWLRGFGFQFREYGTYVEEDQDSYPFEEWVKQAEPLANACAFAATVLLREDSTLVPMAETMAWILCCALESQFDDVFSYREADVYIPGAAAFMRIAGRRIYELCVRGEQTSASGRAGGPLWHGARELNVERWQFWKDRFAEFASMYGAGEDCRRCAAEAVASIAQAEEQYHAA